MYSLIVVDRSSDGHVAVAPSTEAIVTKFLTVIGLEHLQSWPGFWTSTVAWPTAPN